MVPRWVPFGHCPFLILRRQDSVPWPGLARGVTVGAGRRQVWLFHAFATPPVILLLGVEILQIVPLKDLTACREDR